MLKLLALLFIPTLALASPDLALYKWKSRVLVIRSSDLGTLLAVRDKLKVHAMALHERDVVIVEDRTGDSFEIDLYGKDGGRKWQGGRDFKIETIIELIDSMPMRKEESRAP